MKKRLSLALSVLLGSVGVVAAQPAPAPESPFVDASSASQNAAERGGRFWATGESLLWWMKAAPLPVPTLTTFVPGSPSDTTGFGGALGVDGTIVLSPDRFRYDAAWGGRITLGGWVDDEQRLGVEVSGFLLQTQNAQFAAASDATGNPSLRGPFINVPPGAGFPLGESSFVLAIPDFAAGSQSIVSSTRLWGLECNGLYQVLNNDVLHVSLVGGFRYLNLKESLTITSQENILGFGSFTATDEFGTRNRFYGGQIGVKADARFERFFAAVQGKLALGVDRESVNINGSAFTTVGAITGTTPGGLFAQPSNMGQQFRNEFAYLPSAQLQVGMDVTSHIRAFVGYDILYISKVVRPGDQIDRTINFTQNAPVSGVNPPVLAGEPRPAPLFRSSDFWAQGVSLGIQFSW